MKFENWTIDSLIEYLQRMKFAPKDRLDYHCVPRCRGEIIIENGEPLPGYKNTTLDDLLDQLKEE